jgi:N-acetylmuramoyl-L-alanine amidase
VRFALGVALLGAALPAAARDEPVAIRVNVDISRDGTRIVVRHGGPVDYAVRASRGRLEVVYTRPVVADPPEQRFDDPVLERFEMAGDSTLILFTGPGYQTYETFELRNPFRLVIDLQGTRATPAPRTEPARPGARGPIVVLDPGHGGVEEGAIGPTGLREKEVTLDLARRLRRELEDKDRITVVLTRDEDRYVDLDERTAIANHNRAELFVSIHLNASRRSSATGAETYYLSAEATDDEARTLAALENRSHGVDEGAVSQKDAATGLDLVLWDLAQNQYMAESAALAESVQRHFNELMETRDRGVKQAPFRVLMGATMPAILVEVGFISNPDEEEKFKSLTYRNQVTEALARAVRDYLQALERLSRPGAARGQTGNP